jgi:hypothetical protein
VEDHKTEDRRGRVFDVFLYKLSKQEIIVTHFCASNPRDFGV